MARKRRTYDDDDGRTIADMSGVGRTRLISPGGKGQDRPPPPQEPFDGEEADRLWEQPFTRQERRWYILGALKAALLIAAVFIVGLGLFIALLLWVWG